MATYYSNIKVKAFKELEYILDSFKHNYDFYECDFSSEYSSFEESIKKFCDSYVKVFLDNGDGELIFDSLTSVFEAIINVNSDMYYENFFRPVELMTYYLGRIAISDDYLKNKVYDWILEFIDKYGEDMIIDEYFKPFIDGKGIYHADEYYTNYKDFNKVTKVYK